MTVYAVEAKSVPAYQEQLVTIYRRAFARPPYGKDETEIAEFARSLPRHLVQPGFRMVIAEAQPGLLAGFAYGFNNDPDHLWYREAAKALPAAVVAEWLAGGFRLVEIAVTPEMQGRGIGGRLHDRLLQGVVKRRATLLTIAADSSAYQMYRKRGWILLHGALTFPGIARPYRLMGHEPLVTGVDSASTNVSE